MKFTGKPVSKAVKGEVVNYVSSRLKDQADDTGVHFLKPNAINYFLLSQGIKLAVVAERGSGPYELNDYIVAQHPEGDYAILWVSFEERIGDGTVCSVQLSGH